MATRQTRAVRLATEFQGDTWTRHRLYGKEADSGSVTEEEEWFDEATDWNRCRGLGSGG